MKLAIIVMGMYWSNCIKIIWNVIKIDILDLIETSGESKLVISMAQ